MGAVRCDEYMKISDFLCDRQFALGFAEYFIAKMHTGECCFYGERNDGTYKLFFDTVELLVKQMPLPAAIACYIMLLTGCRHGEIKTISVLLNGDNSKVFIKCPKQDITREITTGRDLAMGVILLVEYIISAGLSSRGEISRYVQRNHFKLYNKLKPRHLCAAHAFRHLHISVALKCSGAVPARVSKQFKWSTIELLDTYSALMK